MSREVECLLLSFPANHILVWWHWCKLEFCKLRAACPQGSRDEHRAAKRGKEALALWMLKVFASSFGLWFGQENKGITSGL